MSKSDKFWDRTAERYAKSPVSDEATYLKKLVETQSFFRPNMRIVEFGCGTGTTAVHHAPHVQHIDAIDISENMLEIGRRKARDTGFDNITFTRNSLCEFNAEDASFDAVLGLNVIVHDRAQSGFRSRCGKITKRLEGSVSPSLFPKVTQRN